VVDDPGPGIDAALRRAYADGAVARRARLSDPAVPTAAAFSVTANAAGRAGPAARVRAQAPKLVSCRPLAP